MTSFAPSFAAALAVAALSPVGAHALAATADGSSTASPSTAVGTLPELTVGPSRPRGRRLALRGRTVSVVATCANDFCDAATWRLRRDGRTVATFRVPVLNGYPERGVRATLATSAVTTARRAGSRGLGVRLSGDGFATRSVRVVRNG